MEWIKSLFTTSNNALNISNSVFSSLIQLNTSKIVNKNGDIESNSILLNNKYNAIKRYEDVMNEEWFENKYPGLKEYLNNDKLLKPSLNSMDNSPKLKLSIESPIDEFLDDTSKTLRDTLVELRENATDIEKMKKESQPIFKQLLGICLIKSEIENIDKGYDYYHYKSGNYYRREDLIQEFSFILFGDNYDKLIYVMHKWSVLEMTRIYLEEGYYLKGRDKNEFYGKYMNFSVEMEENRGAYETNIPLKEPILKVEYNDGDVKTVQYHGNYELAYRKDVL